MKEETPITHKPSKVSEPLVLREIASMPGIGSIISVRPKAEQDPQPSEDQIELGHIHFHITLSVESKLHSLPAEGKLIKLRQYRFPQCNNYW